VSGDGTLVYRLGGLAILTRKLVWVDRTGKETSSIPAPPRAYIYPRLSPDGARISLFVQDQQQDVWFWELARQTLTRFTLDPGLDAQNAWTPDGKWLIFSSERSGARNLFRQAADGTGAIERLTESPNLQNVTAITPDGTHIIFAETMPKTGSDVMQMTLDGTRRITPLIQTPFTEENAIVSPDGHWIAYNANDSGQFEVYVRPFPDVNTGHWQVSNEGGARPLWSRDGRELFYVSNAGELMRTPVDSGPSWGGRTPTTLFKLNGYFTGLSTANNARTYDISPDGQRFLVVKEAERSEQSNTLSRNLIVVQHFDEELKRLVPTK